MTGTARYASINCHLGYEQSRRDDLEGIAYILAYFVRGGKLPWIGEKATTRKQKLDLIRQSKENTPIDELYEDFPIEFSKYLQYCRSLEFDEKPDYNYLKSLFDNLMVVHEFEMDFEFDWVIKKNRKIMELLS